MGINWGISDSYFTRADMKANNEGMYTRGQNQAGGSSALYLYDATNDNSDFNNALTDDIPYYLTIERSGTTLTCKIYSDSARTVLVDTLSLVCTNTTYRSIIGYGADTNHNYHTYTENLDLQEAAAGGSMQPMKHWGGI